MTWAPMLSLSNLAEGGLFSDGDWVESKDQDPSGTVRLTQLADVGVGEFRDRSDRWLRPDQARDLRCTFLEPGDVLIARMPDPLGRACLAPPSIGTAVTVVDVSVLRIQRPDIDPHYVMWAINSPLFHAEVEARQSGTTRKRISRKNLSALTVPVPPLKEQRRIVDLLEDHISRLDAAETFVRDGLRRMHALRKAHLQEAFDERPAELRPLLDVASIANGQTPKGLVEILSPETGNDSVPFFKVGDMNAADGRWMNDARFFVSRESTERLGIHVRPAGTVLIPKRGGAIATNKKRILRSPAAYDLNTMGLVPNDSLDSSYLWHWLQTVDLGRIADGSNVPQINATQVRELVLPVPELQAQVAIADRLDEIDESLTRLAQQVESVRRRGGSLRRALLSAAFSGRLTGDVAADLSEVEEMVNA
jgi:type I restriction enzyme S subunit